MILATVIQQDRFWSKVARADIGCWEWMASTDGRYGVMRVNKRLHKAHRVSYDFLVGPVPEGMELDHLCANTLCVRPDHLEPVTHSENLRRAPLRSERTHCHRGHEYTEENTYWRTDGGRTCQTCRKESDRRRMPQILARQRAKYAAKKQVAA